MLKQTLFCGFGLIGDELEVKQNIRVTLSNGIFQDIQVSSRKEDADYSYPTCVIVPGLINAHTHIGDSFAKDRGLERSIQELVEPPNGLKHQLLNEVSNDVLKKGIENAIKEMVNSGITTFVDFRESGEKGIHILKSILENQAIEAIICGRPAPKLESLTRVVKVCNAIGLSSSNIYSDDELKFIRETCRNNGKPILTHVAETREEYSASLNRFKMSEVARAVEMLGADILVHITWAREGDIKLMAEKEKSAVICPRSNLYLGVGFPPLDLLRKHKVLTCLGTDNVMINNLNLFREMEFLFKSARERFGIESITCQEILKMVTINSAKALKLDREIGSIAVGKRGNFLLIDLDAPNISPFSSIYDCLVLRANPLNIMAVFIGGNSVYERD